MTPEEKSDLNTIKLAIYPLQQADSEFRNELILVKDGIAEFSQDIDSLLRRVQVLEEARQRQIALNSTFAVKEAKRVEIKEEGKSKWRLW